MADNTGEEQNEEGKEVKETVDDKDTGGDTGAGDEKVSDEKSEDDKSEDDKSDEGTKDKDKSEDKDKSDDKKSEDKEKSDDKEKSEDAPEEYAKFVIPEGMEVDEAELKGFTSYAKEQNLSQETAQRFVTLHTEAVNKITTVQQEKWDTIKEGWADEVKANKDMHDEKGKADAAIAVSRNMVEKLGGKEMMEAFDLTGAGNHPAVVAAFFRLSKVAGEDDFVFGGGAGDSRTRAEKMFPSMKPKG